ncbi:ABC transporter [Amycolatopsis coloradensis]|uniref:Transport permease protein n=1 Tax=Amycolatopsis coloradensis TaxID=76021 RepID=A0A1R0KWS3_9PSEU|nr:ABC transporter permease [Amycolatopsis coloradensis]OLZ53416.1 ABC transporter [Amycolatopsis coloradensis]
MTSTIKPTETTEAPEETRAADPTALDAVLASVERPKRPSALSASLTFGWRAALKIKHLPEQLFDVTGFPIIMTVMFTYLFGGAIGGSTEAYLDYLLPGILAITVVMITMYTGVAVNSDIAKGVFDRFRTLPIWRPATIVGYLLGDFLRYLIGCVVIIGVGLIMGYNLGSVAGTVGAVALLLVFSFSLSWIWTFLGLSMRSEKTVMSVSMVALFPLTFLSNVFVQPSTMPGWLEAAVSWNPITHLVTAMRGLMSGNPDVGEIIWVLVASVVLIAGFGSATMAAYKRK